MPMTAQDTTIQRQRSVQVDLTLPTGGTKSTQVRCHLRLSARPGACGASVVGAALYGLSDPALWSADAHCPQGWRDPSCWFFLLPRTGVTCCLLSCK